MPFEKENGEEIGGKFGWEGKIIIHCLRQVEYNDQSDKTTLLKGNFAAI